MDFLIADTLTDSLGRLTGDEQKAVKTTAFDLQMNPAQPGHKLHKLDKAKDKNFWSVRVSADVRLIVHKTAGSLLLCYVDHHDKAYSWAERRKLQTHPKTGAAQMVEVRETVQEVLVPKYVEVETPKRKAKVRKPFAKTPDDELLGYGVPPEWVADVKDADEDELLALADHLPAVAAEALLEVATGGTPRVAKPTGNPFDHPDARRRFRLMGTAAELEHALDAPWEKWTIFLHPDQRELVEKEFAGPARVTGSAGTGKTIVALHRAAHLARTHPDARVLLTTFSDPLAHALRNGLKRLAGGEPKLAERIEVEALDRLALRLHRARVGPAEVADRAAVVTAISAATAVVTGHKFSPAFVLSEWDQLADAWQLGRWEEYRDIARLGRKSRLSEAQRRVLWDIFSRARATLSAKGVLTPAAVFTAVAKHITAGKKPPYDFAVIDEAQDIGVAQLRFFAALAGEKANGLFFAGDLGQRIFQTPFSWKGLGVDVRGRSRTLRVNYRTSHQIRTQADRLLGPTVTDADGEEQKRDDTVSVFNGPPPDVRTFATAKEEVKAVGAWLAERVKGGLHPHEVGVFVRADGQVDRAQQAVAAAKLSARLLDDHVEVKAGAVSVGTMHLAKGLEFRAVAVMACDDEVIPAQARMAAVGDDADLREVYDSERYLLYVACTRARDQLLVSGIHPASEFLADLTGE